MAIAAAGLGVSMFAIASRLHMSAVAVVTLIGLSAAVFCLIERGLNPRPGVLLRGLGVNAVFCLSLMASLWFTTGHPGVLMWVVFATTAATGAAACIGRAR